MNPSLQTIALARTLLFNYGQALWTPRNRYLDCCRLLGCPSSLKPIPLMKEIPFPFSFYSKQFFTRPGMYLACHFFFLYHPVEALEFLSIPPIQRLWWLRNFYDMQEILFSFEAKEIEEVYSLIKRNPPTNYNSQRIPFQLGERKEDESLSC